MGWVPLYEIWHYQRVDGIIVNISLYSCDVERSFVPYFVYGFEIYPYIEGKNTSDWKQSFKAVRYLEFILLTYMLVFNDHILSKYCVAEYKIFLSF